MASKKTRWLLGCGLGCAGVVVIGVIVAGLGGAALVRNTTRGFEQAVQAGEELQQRFGPPGDFVPASDGRIAPERIEAFLAVREATRTAREAIEASFRALPQSREEAEALDAEPILKKIGAIFGITRSALGLGGSLGDYFEARNAGLLAAGMGLGEYTYLYVVGYVSWLGHPLDAGPGPWGPGEVSLADRALLLRVGDDLREMLRRQLDALPPEAAGDAWHTALTGEVARLDGDEGALPWQTGVPAPILESLEPYRERFESAYSEFVNPFELSRARRRGRFSFEVD